MASLVSALNDACLLAIFRSLVPRDVLRLGCACLHLAELVHTPTVAGHVLTEVCRESAACLRDESPSDTAIALTGVCGGSRREASRLVAGLGGVPLGWYRGLIQGSARNVLCQLRPDPEAAAIELIVPLESPEDELRARLVAAGGGRAALVVSATSLRLQGRGGDELGEAA